MVSLPPLVSQEDKIRGSHSLLSGSASSTSTFCEECLQTVPTLQSKISLKVLQQYKDRCAQLRNMENAFIKERSYFYNKERRFSKDSIDEKSERLNLLDNFPTSALPIIKGSDIFSQDGLNVWNRRGIKISPSHQINVLPKLKHRQRNRTIPVETKKTNVDSCGVEEKSENSGEVKLIAEPAKILFDHIEVGSKYEKKIKILNISKSMCKFVIHPVNVRSQFRVEKDQEITSLAAGMSFHLKVTFCCRTLGKTKDNVVIDVLDGRKLNIYLYAGNPPPYLIEVNEENFNIPGWLEADSVVDFGPFFVGDKGNFMMTLKNTGSDARFFFISELNWYTFQIKLDSSNRLETETFAIEPMYFSLGSDQLIELVMSYNCYSKGLHAEQVLLLCDNSALQYIDLLCDGFLYNSSWIYFEGLTKTFDVDIEDDSTSEHFLNFGMMLPSYKKYLNFNMIHEGYVNMTFHWEVRIPNIPKAKSLPEGALRVVPENGRIVAKSSETFCLYCITNSVDPGIYRMSLVLVVDDLPMKCIPLHLHEKLLPFNEDEDVDQHRSIEVRSIEVWVECVKPTILLSPFVIDFSESPLICGSSPQKTTITVQNLSPGAIDLAWKTFERTPQINLRIDLQHFVAKECSLTECNLYVEPLVEGVFNTTIWCVSTTQNVTVQLEIRGSCCKAQVEPITRSVDFGLVRRGAHHVADIIAKNCSFDNSVWTLNELNFLPQDELEESSDLQNFSANQGKFCHKDSEVLLSYKLDTEEDTLWCSVLDWGGCYVPVFADVQENVVELSQYLVTLSELYLEVQHNVTLTVDNLTRIPTGVFWGNPIEQSLDRVTIEVNPRFAMIDSGQKLHIDVYVTPHLLGELKNVYIPCFVEGHTQPLLLKIEGVVLGLTVRVEWDSDSRHYCVFWPPLENIYEDVMPTLALYDPEVGTCPPNSLLGSIQSGEDYGIRHSNNYDLNTLNNDDQESNDGSEASSIPYLNWPYVGGKYWPQEPLSEELESHLKNLFILEDLKQCVEDKDSMQDFFPDNENALYFYNIPVGKGITKTIYIRNDSMISPHYELQVENNFEHSEKSNSILLWSQVEKLTGKDQWDKRAIKSQGLTVFVEPSSGELPADDYVCIQVTVFARSWGCYSDTLIIQLTELDPLKIPIYVTVDQPPVTVQQLMRFPPVSLRTSQQKGSFRVENTSTVPVYICWQVFVPKEDKLPFGVMLLDGDPFELYLSPYYGSCSSQLFEVEVYTFLKPHSSKYIEVTFYPKCVKINHKEEKFSETLRAILIGHVHLTDETKYKTNAEKCIRTDGLRLQPLKVDLEAYVELPLLSLLNVSKNQLEFKCTSYEVMSLEDKRWRQERIIRVQNQCLTPINAIVLTKGIFFSISKISHPCHGTGKHAFQEISLLPGEMCELTVTCEVPEMFLNYCFNKGTLTTKTELENAVLEQGLIVFKQKCIKQEIKINLWLFKPVLKLLLCNFFQYQGSHTSMAALDFGSVTISDTEFLPLIISAPFGKESFEVSIKNNESGVFSLNTYSEVLEPNVEFILKIYFSPRECKVYEDKLFVISCLPKMFQEIPITGIGTFNRTTHKY